MKQWSLDARSKELSSGSIDKTGRSQVMDKDIGRRAEVGSSHPPQEPAISSFRCVDKDRTLQ